MRVGVVFPHHTIGEDPAVMRDFAVLAEELGFAHLMAFDHVLGATHADRPRPFEGPYDERSAFHEPFVLYGFLAGQTARIELATGVVILSQRQTALAAKQAAEVQLLSGGRLRLGVGTGWNYVEYEALGVPWAARGARLEEQVHLMRRLWSEELVDFTGRFHRVDRAGILPRPTIPIPVWMGGYSAAQQDRVARIGDGFFWRQPSSKAYASLDLIRDRAVDVGRDPSEIGFEVMLAGDDAVREIRRWADAGGTHACLHVSGTGTGLLDGLRELADQVGELLSTA